MGSKNPELNAKLKAELTASQPDRSIFSQTAFAAAWTECDDYGEQVAAYVKKNLEFAVEFFRTRIPSIKTYLPAATYLLWLDCSALGFKTQTELSEFFVKEAKVALNPGESFGPGGEQHMRLNTACPRSTLETALRSSPLRPARLILLTPPIKTGSLAAARLLLIQLLLNEQSNATWIKAYFKAATR